MFWGYLCLYGSFLSLILSTFFEIFLWLETSLQHHRYLIYKGERFIEGYFRYLHTMLLLLDICRRNALQSVYKLEFESFPVCV